MARVSLPIFAYTFEIGVSFRPAKVSFAATTVSRSHNGFSPLLGGFGNILCMNKVPRITIFDILEVNYARFLPILA